MEFDDILKNYLGEIGRYQILMLFFISSIGINITLDSVDYIYTGAVPDFWCDVDSNITHLSDNLTLSDLRKLTSPLLDNGKTDSCSMYVRNYSSLSVEDAYGILNGTNITGSVRKCSKWIYSKEQFYSTFASEWDLVCDKEWLIPTSQFVYMGGKFMISFGGFLADRFGRRTITLAAMCLHIIARIGTGLSINFYMFAICRFLLSVASINWYTLGFVLSVEMVGPRWRALAGQGVYFFWSIGYIILAVTAYFIRDWRILTLVLTLYCAPSLSHFCYLPESVRWLLSKDKIDEADVIIKKVAKVNKKKLPADLLYTTKISSASEPKARLIDLFKSAKQIKITLILTYQWLTATFVYYGLVYYMPALGGNIYMNTLISGILEIPAFLYVQLTLDTRFGRRINLMGTLVLSGLILLSLMAIPQENSWLIITLALLGRFVNTAAFSLVYIYTSELFPTSMRSMGVAVCSTMASFGGLMAPYTAILGKISIYLPPSLMGTMSIVAGLIGLFLPETRGSYLPETIKQVGQQHRSELAIPELEGDVDKSESILKNEDLDHKLINNSSV